MKMFLKRFLKSSYNINIVANIVGALFVKGGAIIIGIFIVPAYMNYFDNEIVLGLWYTLLSVFQCVISFDLGIGNGLRNRLTESVSVGDMDKGKKYISSAYLSLGIFSMGIALICHIIFPYINWNMIFNVNPNLISNDVLILCMRIVSWGLMIQFILKNITSVLYALQKSALTNFLVLLSNTVILLYVLLIPSGVSEKNLTLLTIVNTIAINLPLLIANIIIFMTSLKKCRPSISSFSGKYAYDIFKVGMCFFWLQLMIMFVSSINEILISKLTDPTYVVEYQIYYRLFHVGATIFSLALLPIWSAVTKAKAENNMIWVNKLHNILMIMSCFAVLVELLIIPFLQVIVNVWLDENSIQVSTTIAFIFAISNSLLIWHSTNSNIANGLGYLKPQLIFLTLAAGLKIPVAYMLVQITNNWISIIVANIIVLLPITVFQPIWLKRYIKNKIKKCSLITSCSQIG